MPSDAFLSMFSINSENSLASVPVSEIRIAMTPAIGPSPTARTKMSAQII